MRSSILVFVGVRGAGKTTACQHLEQLGVHRVVPSTTRSRRGPDDKEYNFIERDDWDNDGMAWYLVVGSERYGVTRAEIDQASRYPLSTCVFSPADVHRLTVYAATRPDLEFVTVGLDTIRTEAEQKLRVGVDRQESQTSLDVQGDVVRSCHVVLRGDEQVIKKAVEATARLIANRGVIHDDAIARLLAANCLLTDADKSLVQPASYDLRLGDTIWCGGIRAFPENGIFGIPAYSYAIVKAHELARLPKFVVARFDLTVSLFMRGVILSNGPQVDPGYKGALFCLLYNSSDRDVVIRRGEHFASIEFSVTSCVTAGYDGQYQLEEKMAQFMAGDTALSPGGRVLQRFDEIKKSFDDALTSQRWWLGISIALAAAVLLGVAAIAIPAASSFQSQADHLKTEVAAARRDLEEARRSLHDAPRPAGDGGAD